MIKLARQYGRYGYRRVAALLRESGWSVSDGRVKRLWRRERLKVPAKQSKKGWLWLNDGSAVQQARTIMFQLAKLAVTGPMVHAVLAATRRLRVPPSCA